MTAPPQGASAAEITIAAEELLRAGERLRDLDVTARCRAMHRAARLLEDPVGEEGQALRVALRGNVALSSPMIEWCLSTTLASVRQDALLALVHAQSDPGDMPKSLAAVVLAGNVFTAGVRALLLPLLSGVPVLAKAASSDDALPVALQRALLRTEPTLGAALRVVRFGRDDRAATEALLARADVVSVYGDDGTVDALNELAAPNAQVIAHGHGLSALHVGRDALRSEGAMRQAAERAALDIAAYDQRGCLSPHFVLVEQGGAVDVQAFCEQLFLTTLPAIEGVLPLGAVSVEEKAACLQWRAVASARGTLQSCTTHAVSFEGDHALRPSPGLRHIGVYTCDGVSDSVSRLRPFGAHLKCVGVGGSNELRAELAAALQGPRPARVCRAGEMQTPPIAADADGVPALSGYFKRR